MTSCQCKLSTEQYALFKNKVDLFKDFSEKLILTVLSNLFRTLRTHCIQGVSEIGGLVLTGNRTHQKEQLFSLPFWRKTLRNGLKK
jgi:hypothetical protein